MREFSFFKQIRFVFVLLMLLLPALSFAGEFVLVTNSTVPDQVLTRDEVKAIFLGEKTKWSDNSKVTFVLLKMPDLMESFLKQFVGKSVFQFDNYWKYQLFTGKSSLPRSFDAPDSLIDFVRKTPGAICYAPQDVSLNNVKKITVQ